MGDAPVRFTVLGSVRVLADDGPLDVGGMYTARDRNPRVHQSDHPSAVGFAREFGIGLGESTETKNS
jgi:hypothetical protein